MSVLPVNVTSRWGYKVNAVAMAGQPINRGTHEDPIAELPLHVSIEISTVLKSQTRAMNLRVLGTGEVTVDDEFDGAVGDLKIGTSPESVGPQRPLGFQPAS